VTGAVHGGFYRGVCYNEARAFRKLTGRLKELKGDRMPYSTEIYVEGAEGKVRGFVRWVRKGPGLAQEVQTCEVEYGEAVGVFDDFVVEQEP
jgi:acylphosphatase